jgi:hypothetical protein
MPLRLDYKLTCVIVATVLLLYVTGHLDSSLAKTKDEIEKYTNDKVDQQKHRASEVSLIVT